MQHVQGEMGAVLLGGQRDSVVCSMARGEWELLGVYNQSGWVLEAVY